MKKIIGLASFLFLFLLSVLPGNASFASTTSTSGVSITSINFLPNRAVDKPGVAAHGSNNNFVLDLVGLPGDIQLSKLVVTSPTAATLSLFKYSDPMYQLSSADWDLSFSNGSAYLDESKLVGWLKRLPGAPDPSTYGHLTGYLMTVQDVRDIAGSLDTRSLSNLSSANSNPTAMPDIKSPYHIVLYAYDANKKAETPVYLTVVTEGWKLVNGKWYDYDEKGAKLTGWFFYGGKWYYLDKKSGAMVTGSWIKDGSKWYYLNNDGTMKTGWFYYGKKWYYLTSSGAMAANQWVLSGGKWYYFDANGVMKTGWVLVNNKWYFLYNDGHMAANTKIGTYRIGKDGVLIH